MICDWENSWAVDFYCGYRQNGRDYFGKCESWYRALWEKGVPADVVPMDADLSGYALVLAPYLYMLKDGAAERLAEYVKNGGILVTTPLFANADRDDLCFLGGFPGKRTSGGSSAIFCACRARRPSAPLKAAFTPAHRR